MFHAIPCQALHEIYERIPFSTHEQLVFRGLRYDAREQLDAHLGRLIVNGFTEPESFSTRVHIAQIFLQYSANRYDFCLQQHQYTRNATSQLHAVLICDGYDQKLSGQFN